MSTPQIARCAARLPDREAEQFTVKMLEAARLGRRAAELRREAWAVYYESTGRRPKARKA